LFGERNVYHKTGEEVEITRMETTKSFHPETKPQAATQETDLEIEEFEKVPARGGLRSISTIRICPTTSQSK